MALSHIGERIVEERESRLLRQAELAERAGISASTLSQIESGRVPKPHIGTLRKIARALDVEPEELTSPKALAGPRSRAQAPQITLEELEERGIDATETELEVLNQRAFSLWRSFEGGEPYAFVESTDIDEKRMDILWQYVLMADDLLTEPVRKGLRRALLELARK
jgi:transcriptional regulator with XRE-family HTH domain